MSGSFDIPVTVDDAVAAERRKNVAPGASPGYACREALSPGRGERCALCLSPLRGWVRHQREPRAAPGATFFRRFAASPPSRRGPRGRATLALIILLFVLPLAGADSGVLIPGDRTAPDPNILS